MTPRGGLGPVNTDYDTRCMYSGPSPDVAAPCPLDAVVHVMVAVEVNPHTGDQVVAMATCAEHLDIAHAVGEVIAEHPHEGWCGAPGVCWDTVNNRCVLDDGGVEPEPREAVLVLGAR